MSLFDVPPTATNLPVLSSSCPLNSGLAILDQLLATLGQNRDATGLDAALDVRLALATGAAPATILSDFFRLRAVVEERHYLACYRFRRWLDSHYVARVQLDRSQPAITVPFQLAAAPSFSDLCDQCAHTAGASRAVRPWVRVHFLPASGVQA